MCPVFHLHPHTFSALHVAPRVQLPHALLSSVVLFFPCPCSVVPYGAQLGPAVGGYVLATLLTGRLADRAAKRHGDTVSM